ncbi:MAG: 5'-nucleotidase C-terminal domain-containing protein [Paludibacteraceae bacterium]|nr:5'-nucleotidase C-terminal domain-containing protein [Paludibacteraceae bacterium]
MRKLGILFAMIVVFSACQHKPVHVVSVTTEAIEVNGSCDALEDQAYVAALEPIKEALESEMSVQIGYAPAKLWVAPPECPMLNWASDALWACAQRAYEGKVDIAVVNIGGMRCEWPAGPITRQSVFELMPFDNRLVVLTLKGSDLLELFQAFVNYGGQGVAGMRMTAVDGKLAHVEIGGKVLNPKQRYTVATSDYLAGGADHMDALTKYEAYWNSDLLIRDLYLEEVQREDTIRAAVDGRMKLL